MASLSRRSTTPYDVSASDLHLRLWSEAARDRLRVAATVRVMTDKFSRCTDGEVPYSELAMLSFTLELAEDAYSKHVTLFDGNSVLQFLDADISAEKAAPIVLQASRGTILPGDTPLNTHGTAANPYVRVVLLPVYHGNHFGMLAYHPQSAEHRNTLFYYDSIGYAGPYKARVQALLSGMKRARLFTGTTSIQYVESAKQSGGSACGYFAVHFGRFLANCALVTAEPPVLRRGATTVVSRYGDTFIKQTRVLKEVADTSQFLQQLLDVFLRAGVDQPDDTDTRLVGGLTLADVTGAYRMTDAGAMQRVLEYSLARLRTFHTDLNRVFDFSYVADQDQHALRLFSARRPLESRSAYAARGGGDPTLHATDVYAAGIWDDVRKSSVYDSEELAKEVSEQRVPALQLSSAYLIAQFVAQRDRRPDTAELRYLHYHAGLHDDVYVLPQVVWHRLAMQALADTVRVRSRVVAYINAQSHPILHAHLSGGAQPRGTKYTLNLSAAALKHDDSCYAIDVAALQANGASVVLRKTKQPLDAVVHASLHADVHATFNTHAVVVTIPSQLSLASCARGPISTQELLQRGHRAFTVQPPIRIINARRSRRPVKPVLSVSVQFTGLLGEMPNVAGQTDAEHLAGQWLKSWSLLQESSADRLSKHLREDMLRELRAASTNDTALIVGQLLYTPFAVYAGRNQRYPNILASHDSVAKDGALLFAGAADTRFAKQKPDTIHAMALATHSYVQHHNELPPNMVLYPIRLAFPDGRSQHTDYETLKSLWSRRIVSELPPTAWLARLDDTHISSGSMDRNNGSMRLAVPESTSQAHEYIYETIKVLQNNRSQRAIPQAIYQCARQSYHTKSVDTLWTMFRDISADIGM